MQEISSLDDSILMATITENANLLDTHIKKPMASPNEQKFKVLRIRTELMVSMARNYEDFLTS